MAKKAKIEESAEVKEAREAQTKAIAQNQAEADAIEAQKQHNIDSKRESAERVARKLDAQEVARKKEVAQKAADLKEELSHPLTDKERVDMEGLEKQANSGRYQPDPLDMARLGKYRVRNKIKG